MDAIKCVNLTKYYGKARGIENVTLQIEEGEFFGFIGPNGAGKSTTIRNLLGLIRPGSGQCCIFGHDCWEEKAKTLPQIGYLPSESSFYAGMRVKDVLKYSADLRGKDCTEEAGRLCEVLALDREKKVSDLSFGNKKKTAIVCAMQHKPRLLIMDEPTGGLDPLMQRAFFTLLEERHQEGTTIFLSSHILSEIQKHCTKAAIIKNGKIIACDKVENLTKTNVKRINVDGIIDLTALTGIRNLQSGESGYSFLYNGSMDQLIRMLAKNDIRDLTIHEPDLEEIFILNFL